MSEYIFAIYSCQKNLEIANKMYNLYFSNTQLLNSLKMKVLIVYGDTTIDHQFLVKDDKYLVLHCEDDYENLCSKSLRLFKAINFLYPNALGCFKCDDDIIINMNSLIQFIHYFKTNAVDYSGTALMVKEKKNNVVHLKYKQMGTTRTINTPSAIYCGGPLYYLSKNAVSVVSTVAEDEYTPIFYEDLMIGNILNKNKIFPLQTRLYSDHFTDFQQLSFHNTNKKKTLFVRIHGGLGNQMFQVCAGASLAQKNNMNFFIINSSVLKQTFTHIDDNNYLLNTVFFGFNKLDLVHINLKQIKQFKEKEEECFVYNPPAPFNDDVLLNGYFQNEKYFLSIKPDLIKLFKQNEVYKKMVESKDAEMAKNSYFIHVRRGDYVKTDLYAFDTDKYYKIAIQHILSVSPDAHFIIVSDDIEYCKTYAMFNDIKKTFVDLPVLETLYLMSLCEKGGICANSTFSWWGSYLNENFEKVVVFPGKWIQKPWPNDIYYQKSLVVPL
jgi:hypothetical protein